jgi:hypothetical protein
MNLEDLESNPISCGQIVDIQAKVTVPESATREIRWTIVGKTNQSSIYTSENADEQHLHTCKLA